MNMRILQSAAVIAMTGAGLCSAGELGINVIVSGQVTPGVYGQVQIGNAAPPPVVYAQPVMVEAAPPNIAPPAPVYLHVPPEHARDWRHHCSEYHACGRPVYFVRSAEYEPGYVRRDHEHDHGRHGDDHDRD
jgi:hypothetical protein